MAQQLWALPALPEDLLVSGTHTRQLRTTYNFAPGDPITTSGLYEQLHTCACVHTHTCIYRERTQIEVNLLNY